MTFKTITHCVALAALALPGIVAAEDFSVWVRSDGSEYMPKLVKKFNAESEHNANLQIVPVKELVQKYAVASAGGSAPDALALDLIYTPAFAKGGLLRDITQFANTLPYLDDLSPAHRRLGTYEDRIYGLPFSGDASVLMWNKDLFEEAGLDPDKGPSNWAEIEKAAKAVNKLGDDTYGFYFSGKCPACNIFTMMPLVWASGGGILADNGQTATLDAPEIKDLLSFYRGMVEDGLIPAGAQTDTGVNFFSAFANGNIGITLGGSFAIGALNNNYPDLDYGVAYLPGKHGDWSSFAGGDNFVISADTSEDKLPAIHDFIEFAYSVEGQTILARNGAVPVRGDVAEQALSGLDERYLIPAKAMAGGKTPYTTVFNDIINSRNGPWITMLGRAIYADNDAEVQEAIDDAQAEMQSIIDAAN